jgi:putative transposase
MILYLLLFYIFKDIKHYKQIFMRKKKKPEIDNITYQEKYNKLVGNFRYISCWYLYKHNCDYLIPDKFIPFFNDKKFEPFWNNKKEKMSKEIFMPNKENMKPNMMQNLKFNKNKWFNSEFNVSVSEVNNPIRYKQKENNFVSTSIISKKIMFIPNKLQRDVLKELFGQYRYFYNRTIEFFNNYDKTKSFYYVNPKDKKTKKEFIVKDKNIYNMYTLRNYIKCNYPQWMKKIKLQSHGIDFAIKEAVDNILKCFKQQEKTGKTFRLKFKTKKDLIQTMNIEKTMLSSINNTIFAGMKIDKKFIFKDGIRLKENIKKYDFKDSSLSYDVILSRFYLNLNHSIKNNKNENNKVCAIDPGIKNFVTIFDESSVTKIGINCKKTIAKLCLETDIIKSRIDKKSYVINDIRVAMNANRRRNLKKALRRKIIKLKNIRDELHKQTISYLVGNYSRIILPPFESKKIDKKLSSTDTRILKCLSYYKFKERLRKKAETMNIFVDEKEEYYTSKTCTKCGNIDYNLGNKNVYNCKKCDIILERDYNGARNIMLRNF